MTDPRVLSPEIGMEEELRRLSDRLKMLSMTWLQDIVPNHMAYDPGNPWIHEVLEYGRDAEHYSFFDIFRHPVGTMGERLMAPFLGGSLAECLAKGELRLEAAGGSFVIRYYDKAYPVARQLYDRVADRIDLINADPLLLEALLLRQHYLLTAAGQASKQVNYRRFFTINGLICLRMEDGKVFDAYHERIGYWYQQGWIQGLRIDHIDGLADPKGYCERLRDRFGNDCYIIAEKILTGEELLREDWRLDGTTGYDFLSFAGQLLSDAGGRRQLLDFYRRDIVGLPDYPDVVYERKYAYLRTYMGGELDELLLLLTGDSLFTSVGDENRLREALAVVMASFPVYRGYPDGDAPSPADAQIFEAAIARARQLRPEFGSELQSLENFLQRPTAFRSRLMQFTGPLAAKGIEDTTFYVYNPYIAYNEVGDSPAIAGLTVEEFHRKMVHRQRHFPHTLNGTSTHDTKRGEDARVRLQLLSACPQAWIDAVTRWRTINRSVAGDAGDKAAPDPNDEYLIYQALLGGFPEDGVVTDEFRERFAAYLTKALREAKTNTNYDSPNESYERRCQEFVSRLLADDSPFLRAFLPFAMPVIRQSFTYSLSLLLLKLTAPGIPDIYQGADLWDTSFVDPDNRRPVDYAVRSGMLDQLIAQEANGPEAALSYAAAHREKGAEKLFTLYRTLNFRRANPRLFTEGEYVPLLAEGPWLAFVRSLDIDRVLVAVPLVRMARTGDALTQRTGETGHVLLPPGPPGDWTDLFTGKIYKGGQKLQLKTTGFPVVVLTSRAQ
ncbi:MAG: malto-oligosyltrehalose synthase, partial [Bacteroidetes bacterium]|nr:malto-oligosyltrehalose synthase [Bacteroidota bacterium]